LFAEDPEPRADGNPPCGALPPAAFEPPNAEPKLDPPNTDFEGSAGFGAALALGFANENVSFWPASDDGAFPPNEKADLAG